MGDNPEVVTEYQFTNELIESILQDIDLDLNLIDYSFEHAIALGNNFMSIIYRVNIKVKSKKTDEEKDPLIILIKTMPRTAMRRNMANETNIFTKEGLVYNKVLKEYEEFQKSKGLSDNELFNAYPICYKTYHDQENDYIVMEDLKLKGFLMGDRRQGLDLEHTELVLKQMAKFHAISYSIFKGKYDNILKKYPLLADKLFKDPDPDVCNIEEDSFYNFLTGTMHQNAAILRKIGDGDEYTDEANILEKIGNNGRKAYAFIYNNLIKYASEDICVINHGDAWLNNVLFSYEKNEQDETKVKDMVFVDFQICRPTSRSMDLLYFLFTSVKVKVLEEIGEDHLLKIYFKEFTDFCVNKLGCNSNEKAFDYEIFKAEFNSKRFFGFAMGSLLAIFLCAKDDNILNMDELSEDDLKDDSVRKELFNKMMRNNNELVNKILYLVRHQISKCNLNEIL